MSVTTKIIIFPKSPIHEERTNFVACVGLKGASSFTNLINRCWGKETHLKYYVVSQVAIRKKVASVIYKFWPKSTLIVIFIILTNSLHAQFFFIFF